MIKTRFYALLKYIFLVKFRVKKPFIDVASFAKLVKLTLHMDEDYLLYIRHKTRIFVK